LKKEGKDEFSSTPPKIKKEDSKRSIFANNQIELKKLKIVTHQPKEEKDALNNDDLVKKQKK